MGSTYRPRCGLDVPTLECCNTSGTHAQAVFFEASSLLWELRCQIRGNCQLDGAVVHSERGSNTARFFFSFFRPGAAKRASTISNFSLHFSSHCPFPEPFLFFFSAMALFHEYMIYIEP